MLSSGVYALFSALSNSLSSFQVSAVFYAGGELIKQGKVTFVGIFRQVIFLKQILFVLFRRFFAYKYGLRFFRLTFLFEGK